MGRWPVPNFRKVFQEKTWGASVFAKLLLIVNGRDFRYLGNVWQGDALSADQKP